jgi:hypothetical protein
MSQCLHAAEAMFNTPMPPPPMISPIKRKSQGDLEDYAPKRQAVESPGELSPRGFSLGPNIQSATQPVNIQPRPNGYAPAPLPPLGPAPAVSASPYNPTPTGRRRGRPPKSVQNTRQVSTYPSIAPSPAASSGSQPHSPGLHGAPPPQSAAQGPSDPKQKKKALPDIAPRPVQGGPNSESAIRSPAVPGADYQSWREETSRRDYYQVQSSEPASRERPSSAYPPILPRPRSPYPLPPPGESARPASTELRRFEETPPATTSEPTKKENRTSAGEPIKT